MLNQSLGLPFSRHADQGYGVSDQQREAYYQALCSRLQAGGKATNAHYAALRAQSQACINPVCTEPTLFEEIEYLRVFLRKLRFEILWDEDKQVKRLENLVTDFTTR